MPPGQSVVAATSVDDGGRLENRHDQLLAAADAGRNRIGDGGDPLLPDILNMLESNIKFNIS